MRQVVRFAAVVALVGVFGCNENKTDGPAATPETKPSAVAMSVAPATSAAPAATAEAPKADSSAAAPTEVASAASSAAAPTEVASAAAPATSAAAASSATTGPKTFDCGAKGQKACPMQGWMKGVMGPATSSGDAEKIAKGLSYIAAKPPPGMGSWTAISTEGAAKAKAGDIDGAKASCKKCHDLYEEKYKTAMRDRPW